MKNRVASAARQFGGPLDVDHVSGPVSHWLAADDPPSGEAQMMAGNHDVPWAPGERNVKIMPTRLIRRHVATHLN